MRKRDPAQLRCLSPRPGVFVCGDSDWDREVERENQDLADAAEAWHRHNRWRRWRVVDGGKRKKGGDDA